MARLEGHCGKDCDRDRVIAEYNITGLIFSFRKETLEYKYKYVVEVPIGTLVDITPLGVTYELLLGS
jgi:hypothetical protein